MSRLIKAIQIIYLAYYTYYLVKFGSNEGPKREEAEWFVISSLIMLFLNVFYFYRKKKAGNI